MITVLSTACVSVSVKIQIAASMKWAWPSNEAIVIFARVSNVTLSMSIVPNQKQWLNQGFRIFLILQINQLAIVFLKIIWKENCNGTVKIVWKGNCQ